MGGGYLDSDSYSLKKSNFVKNYSNKTKASNYSGGNDLFVSNLDKALSTKISDISKKINEFNNSIMVIVELIIKLKTMRLKELNQEDIMKYSSNLNNQVLLIKELLDSKNFNLYNHETMKQLLEVIRISKTNKIVSDIKNISNSEKRNEFIIHLYRIIIFDLQNLLSKPSESDGGKISSKKQHNNKNNSI